MKARLFVIFCILFFSFTESKNVYAFSENYLWIEFGEGIKEKNGAIALPLQVNYGRFPAENKDILELGEIKAFYAPINKENIENTDFYKADLQKNNTGYQLIIKPSKESYFIVVIVEAKKDSGKIVYQYLAKTSFFFFADTAPKLNAKPVLPDEMNRQFELYITPAYNYWTQTGDPLKITALFNKKNLKEKTMLIYDKNKPFQQVETDKTGSCVYIPPNDPELNKQSDAAFKQNVIVAEEIKGNTRYISSYTLLLHRSRFGNYRIIPGISLFFGSIIIILFLVILKRRRFKS